ncbi:ATP-binding cassette domain-containing protein [Tindallia californiensis]|uniref:ABC-type lipoprotein export system, ATPase component n=1 Tax=Tindallia californiensis TaxID=159292 RepID=A0A1H3R540_9FIRM|nr:ATP-binding cassette domain-containing protein [Tindallia californiensis]SDZ20807.1 ABC-type lipoprotein export system, ATPase component [Tindallia californiensis]
MLREITILGGRKKNGEPEAVQEVTVQVGQVYSIVGFTGSGKSQLINDIEQIAQRDSISRRQILLDGEPPLDNALHRYEQNLVAHLSQNMNFILDMKVKEFLIMHAGCRGFREPGKKAEEVIECANTFAGEAIKPEENLTRLSGGQSRSLMIADVAINGDSPVVLIDEVENAGIHRLKAMETLAAQQKIVLVVTHDPLLALLGEKRIIMGNGGMQAVLALTQQEVTVRGRLEKMAGVLQGLQDQLRQGESVSLEFQP